MGIEVAGLGSFIILVLNVWALVSIVSSAASVGRKVIWSLLVLILPLLGFIIWFFAGPRGKAAAA